MITESDPGKLPPFILPPLPPKSLWQRFAEKRREIGLEWLKWTFGFIAFVAFAWGFQKDLGLIDWLNSTLNFFDPAGPFGAVTKGIFLLGLYVSLFAAHVMGMISIKNK